jgi:hypothetical protein
MYIVGLKNLIYTPPLHFCPTSRPKDNSKEEMEQSYSCIILFISKTKNILLASRFINKGSNFCSRK